MVFPRPTSSAMKRFTRDDAGARIAARLAEGVQLLEDDAAHAGLLVELAPRGVVERLVDADEAAGQRPAAAVRRIGALDDQGLQHAALDGQQHDVDGDRRALELAGVVLLQELGVVGRRRRLGAGGCAGGHGPV